MSPIHRHPTEEAMHDLWPEPREIVHGAWGPRHLELRFMRIHEWELHNLAIISGCREDVQLLLQNEYERQVLEIRDPSYLQYCEDEEMDEEDALVLEEATQLSNDQVHEQAMQNIVDGALDGVIFSYNKRVVADASNALKQAGFTEEEIQNWSSFSLHETDEFIRKIYAARRLLLLKGYKTEDLYS